MKRTVEGIAAFRDSGDPADLLDLIPYMRFLGLSLRLEDGQVLATMPYAEHLVGNPALPALHGGTLGSLLESVSIFQILWDAETLVIPKTVSLTVDYLRSGRPLDTHARCTITRHGRRVLNVRAEAWQDDPARPIAAAHAHFLVTPPGEDAGEKAVATIQTPG